MFFGDESYSSNKNGVSFKNGNKLDYSRGNLLEFEVVLEKIERVMLGARRIVVHNANFDLNVIKAEALLYRPSLVRVLDKIDVVCTYKQTKKSLNDLYMSMLNKERVVEHNALHDALDLCACYYEMNRRVGA